jgi:hypothetical protein
MIKMLFLVGRLAGLLRNPDEIGYAFHWAGIQLGRHGGKRHFVENLLKNLKCQSFYAGAERTSSI